MKHSITEDEFLAWRDHPITQWVMGMIEGFAAKQQEGWLEASWDTGECDRMLLVELRTRADAYRALIDNDFHRWSELNEPSDT